jgi:hypothetical protein
MKAKNAILGLPCSALAQLQDCFKNTLPRGLGPVSPEVNLLVDQAMTTGNLVRGA